jgi:hypothetical protein
MSFLLKNIDRAIEWCIKDEVIKRNLWPAQRTFTTDSQLQNALTSMGTNPKVDVFGVANFTDREQLKENNIIISRSTPTAGSTGNAFPYRFELQPNKTFSKIRGSEGSVDIEYEIRFVAFNVAMDRTINELLIKCLSNRKFLPGMNDDLTNMSDQFLIQRIGDPVDLSGKNFIERVFRYVVLDIELNEDEVAESNIPPMKQIDVTLNVVPAESDVLYPESQNDVVTVSAGVSDFFLGLVEDLGAWKKFKTARLYAQENQANALRDLKRGGNIAINSGLGFTAYKGFNRSAVGQYIDTLFNPSDVPLTSYSYAVFVTDVLASGITELFGLIDAVQTTSFFLRDNSVSGIQAKGNSDSLLQLTLNVKPNTLYVFNRRDLLRMEIFEGDKIIGTLEMEPTLIPTGKIFDLNIGNQVGAAVGTSTGGGLSFSAAGEGLRGSDIKEFNAMIRFFMAKIGVIPA